jgi:GNAT superfamily N-acetyltransferase
MAYPSDPAEREAILRLLGATWPRLARAIARAVAWGADWYRLSTPFLSRDPGGEPRSHVGVWPVELAAGGWPLAVAGIHAVCTHPAHRGRGLLRRPMVEALAWLDARWETALLWTDKPGLYQRYGFEVREELAFVGALPPLPAGAPAGRPLDPDRPEDLPLLRGLLAGRTPVSARPAAADRGDHFLIDLAIRREAEPDAPPLRWLPDLGCAVAWRRRGAALVLEDVVAREVPPLRELAARLAGEAREVEVRFTPDRLDAPWLAPAPRPPTEVLMVRGRPLPAGPLALSPLTQT